MFWKRRKKIKQRSKVLKCEKQSAMTKTRELLEELAEAIKQKQVA